MKKQFALSLSVLLILALCACSVPQSTTVTKTNTETITQTVTNNVTNVEKETSTVTLNTTEIVTVKEIHNIKVPQIIEKTVTETGTGNSDLNLNTISFQAWSNYNEDLIDSEYIYLFGKPTDGNAIFRLITPGDYVFLDLLDSDDMSTSTSTDFTELLEAAKEFGSASMLNSYNIQWVDNYYKAYNIPYYLNATCSVIDVYYRYNSTSEKYETTTTALSGWNQGKLFCSYNYEDNQYLIIDGDLNNTTSPVTIVEFEDNENVSESSKTILLTYQDMSITQTAQYPYISKDDNNKYFCISLNSYLLNEKMPVCVMFGL